MFNPQQSGLLGFINVLLEYLYISVCVSDQICVSMSYLRGFTGTQNDKICYGPVPLRVAESLHKSSAVTMCNQNGTNSLYITLGTHMFTLLFLVRTAAE